MEIESPYLQAIQAIAGKTPGEKLKTINRIARRLAQAERSGGQSVDSETQIPDIPEPLKPVVRVEVAKILHQYDVIIDALKSEDMNVVSRALHAKWFFYGSDTSVVNAQYFLENVFPEISLYARLRIVKNFATYLRNTALAADFFLTLTQQYGVSQAIPLLVACTEDFAFKMIIENKIILSIRMVESLYRKYPNLVMKYLMLSKPADDDVRNIYRINIRDYEKFLSEVARDRFEDFIDICHIHEGLQVKLGKTASKRFFKTKLNLLVEKPTHYIKLLSLKMVTQKLSVADFKKMFKNLFPTEKDAFSYSTLNSYLQYYEPEREKVHLILDIFREVYGKDLLSFKHLVDSDLMKVLPEDDRVKQAKLKLEDDKGWHYYWCEDSWRCYLSTCDSIPIITKEIAKCSNFNNRGRLLNQLIYTCKVNDDKDAFLKVLNYIYDRHRNEDEYNLSSYLWMFSDSFDLAALSSKHWEILNKFIKFTQMRGDLYNPVDDTSELIGAGIHYCLLNGLPLDDHLHMFVDTKMRRVNDNWNIKENYPDLEKKILHLCIEVVPERYPIDHKIWNNCEGNILLSIASSLWDFNERNKVSNGKFKKLSIEDYPWLCERIKNYILVGIDETGRTKLDFAELMKKNERDFYFLLLRDIEEFWTFEKNVIFDVLKQQPQRVLDHWEECLNVARNPRYYERHESSFLTKIRWFQDLPMNFFKESLKTYNDPELRASRKNSHPSH